MKCPIRIYSCPIEKSGATSWIQILDLELDNSLYNDIGKKMENRHLVKTTYLGENNHQYGLIGDKNSSFKGLEIMSNYGYILEYCPGHPKPCDRSNKESRVRQHRLVIER